MEKEIDLDKIYDETWNTFNQMCGVGSPMADKETIAKAAMKIAVELALNIVDQEQKLDENGEEWEDDNSQKVSSIIQDVKDSIK